MAVGDVLFVSGQLPIDPSTGGFSATGAVGQRRHCLANINAIAEAAGADISRTVKTTILLTDLSGCALPKGALVEVEAVSYSRKRRARRPRAE